MSIPSARLLNKSQAKAICDALSALNNVATQGPMELEFHDFIDREPRRIQVSQGMTGLMRVSIGGGLLEREREEFETQAAFATAYGMD